MSVRVQDQGNGRVGGVAVVGAGIGGMQASLDLANAGFKVYLIERSSAIGGRMAQLDKTFPTNDCSMCIISPKLVEVGRHPDIELLTHTEVLGLHGSVGNFSLELATRAKYVDPAKCTGCGECANHCPVELPNEFDEGLSTRRAISILYPQAIPNAFSIDKRGVAPCKVKCPTHISVQGYVALTAQGKFKEALQLIKQDNPLPAVCGRVCHHPCEEDCTRGRYDSPVAIKAVKRFLADREPEMDLEPPAPENDYGEKVAIVGSGPAGLTAAYYLALRGYRPTIFESAPEAGGMLRTGIPPYRLPRDVLDAEIDYIRRAGVEIRTNAPVGGGITFETLQEQGYQAFFLGTGAHAERDLRIEGEDLPGVLSGYAFLRSRHLGEPVTIGRKVIVVGGGNVAMDAARTALRLGADEVHLVYRRTEREMPARVEEVRHAKEEGVTFHLLQNAKRILGNEHGCVAAMECLRYELGEPDDSGRRRPIEIPGSEFTMSVDTVIVAIGNDSNPLIRKTTPEIEVNRWGNIVADDDQQTSMPRVFAGGDIVLGAATVILAMGQGRRAAAAINRMLADGGREAGESE